VRNSAPHMKTSLSANAQPNRSNFDLNLKSSLPPFFYRALQLFAAFSTLDFPVNFLVGRETQSLLPTAFIMLPVTANHFDRAGNQILKS